MGLTTYDFQVDIFLKQSSVFDFEVNLVPYEVEITDYFDFQVNLLQDTVGDPLPSIPSIAEPTLPEKTLPTIPDHRADVSTFQSRLGMFQDRLRRKMIDNSNYLTGSAVDAIRIRTNRTKQGDITSRIVEEATVVPIIFPPLKGVPFRRLQKNNGKWSIETLPAATDLFPITLQTTQYNKIERDDLIIRILKDVYIDLPIVQVLQITEPKADFGAQSLIKAEFDSVYYNEQLPPELVETIVALAQRRMYLRW
jgi:hypothetical protein